VGTFFPFPHQIGVGASNRSKSQGLTFDRAIILMIGQLSPPVKFMWSLSRFRSLEGFCAFEAGFGFWDLIQILDRGKWSYLSMGAKKTTTRHWRNCLDQHQGQLRLHIVFWIAPLIFSSHSKRIWRLFSEWSSESSMELVCRRWNAAVAIPTHYEVDFSSEKDTRFVFEDNLFGLGSPGNQVKLKKRLGLR